MADTTRAPMLRSAFAVLAGFAVWTVLFLGLAAAIRALVPAAHGADGSVYAVGPLVLYLLLAVAASALAGFVTYRVATSDRDRAVLWTGVVLLAVGLAVQIPSWSLAPTWYNVAFLLGLVPATVAGGRLAARRAVAAG